MNDIDIGNFADNNAPYMSAEKNKSLDKSFTSTACRTFRWFTENQLKGNGDILFC